MSRLSFALVILVGILAGGLGVSMLRPQPAALDDTQVRSIVTDMLAGKPVETASIDTDKFNKLIEDYLMSDPTILQRVTDREAQLQRVAQHDAQKAALQAHYAEIYQAKDNVVLGNPKGDVTLVEMFDYNCSYCRGALPDLASLMADDPNLKIILKQFPILTAGSVDAAKIAVLVSEDPKVNYWDFHRKLFAARGEVGADQALQVAEQVGGNRVELMLDMNGKQAAAAIQASYDLAKELGVAGTPTYVLGDEIIPGALGLDQLKQKIANLRACGSTVCSVDGAAAPPAG